jgi:NDP-sugar pyrophosphorylase family protein
MPPAGGSRRAVILAGGRGSRLAPYTTVLPKPLLPVGDRAILDVVVHQLAESGFQDLVFAVGYKSQLIETVFGDGSELGVSIDYHYEETPLGTAGPLATIPGLDDSFLVMNGDVLTTLNYRELYEAHKEAGNALTVATHRRVIETDYGVLELGRAGNRVTGYVEKPEIPYIVSMGVYVAEPSVNSFIPSGQKWDIPDVIESLTEAGERVGSYLFDGFWLDIGRHEDYERVISEFDSLKADLLGDPSGLPVKLEGEW